MDAEEDPLAIACPGGVVKEIRAVHLEGQLADAARRDRDDAEPPVVPQEEDLIGVPIVCSGFRWDRTDEGIEFEAGLNLIELGRKMETTEHGEVGLLER